MILKRARELDIMAQAAVINRKALEAVEAALRPGITTKELDSIAHDVLLSHGAKSATIGYKGSGAVPFSGAICASINEVVVHGVPSEQQLQEGDIISVDVASFYKGYAADMARTFAIGEISTEAQHLLEVTERALYAGIMAAQVQARVGDISSTIQQKVEEAGFWVVREFVGHGLGLSMHESPEVPNFGEAGKGPKLRNGLVIAIEPMVTLSQTAVTIAPDGWSAPTANGCLSAHFEHTVAITNDGPRILTMEDQSPQSLDSLAALMPVVA